MYIVDKNSGENRCRQKPERHDHVDHSTEDRDEGEERKQLWRIGEADDSQLDRYVRQRRTANIEYVQESSIRNKRTLE